MSGYVVATAGHVDHGKSTLVRALTGMEPDRWEEERRRGLTIDLGYAWTTLPSGRDVAFVDVPGHERFLGNMLAGLGPAPVVCFVVAADEGWQAQSGDHRDAVAALGIEHGVVVLTRVDRAPGRVGEVLAQVRAELAGTGLHDAPVVTVSALEGTGLAELRAVLDEVLARASAPAQGRLRLWVDRSFTVTGSGTVVTGTLSAGSLREGERLHLLGHGGILPVVVRGMHSRNEPHTALEPCTRVALNLRGVSASEAHRGDALLTPGAWPLTEVLDVRRVTGRAFTATAEHVVVHAGTAAVPARVSPFDDDHARLVLDRALPLVLGDRVVLRASGGPSVLGGAQVLDADPPGLDRRGDRGRRAVVLAGMGIRGDVGGELARRGVVTVEQLQRWGVVPVVPVVVPVGVRVIGRWWVHEPVFQAWTRRLRVAVEQVHAQDPLAVGLSGGAGRDLLGVPDAGVLAAVVVGAGLVLEGGYIRSDQHGGLGVHEAAVARVERRLAVEPFAAPEAGELAGWGLGPRELAAAERAGRLLRLGEGVVVLPTAPARAMGVLAGLEQPFTVSGARQGLGTTRRVVIPLLEHLDARGWTRRVDGAHRVVVR